jgi:hypothetical protein
MKTNILLALTFLFSPFFPLDSREAKDGTEPLEKESPIITRTIDVTKTFREFPDLVGYWNTSVQKAPAPIVAQVAEKHLGKAKITRCWLNLDEMWDYRDREFEYDFKLGVDKYKEIGEKFRESWDWQVESPSTFYQYMDAFSGSSEEIMLTIRRYERDVLDGKLSISLEDWKMIFKKGLKHYKQKYPNIRYVEVGNEYAGKSFMDGTAEEYFTFYRLGSQAVAEINSELGLSGDDRMLVGGPVVTGHILDKIDKFLGFYAQEPKSNRVLDFIAWHDYHKNIEASYDRQAELEGLLEKHGLPTDLPLFMTEHDPYHYSDDKPEYHFQNAAYLPKSLYFTSIKSPRVKIFPWVLFHNREIQTKFMWFSGPNETDTRETEITTLPLGYSMQFLSMLKGREVEVNNIVDGKDMVLATVEKDRMVVEAINYAGERKVDLRLKNLFAAFPDKKGKQVQLKAYVIDSVNNNTLEKDAKGVSLQPLSVQEITLTDELALTYEGLEEKGMVLWELVY